MLNEVGIEDGSIHLDKNSDGLSKDIKDVADINNLLRNHIQEFDDNSGAITVDTAEITLADDGLSDIDL